MKERLYRHRDLSWLNFNGRVLQEAKDNRNPLYERIKFLAIFSSNLDEFFRVRVSKLRQIKNVDKSIRKKLKLRPTKTLKEIIQVVEAQQEAFGRIFSEEIVPELRTNGIDLIERHDFTEKQRAEIQTLFEKEIKEHVEVVSVVDGETPFLRNNALYFFVRFTNGDTCFVSIPSNQLNRFISLSPNEGHYPVTFLDDVIAQEIPYLFKYRAVQSFYEVKLSRDAELYWEDNFDGEVEPIFDLSS